MKALWFDLWLIHVERRPRKSYPMRSCLINREEPKPKRAETLETMTWFEYRDHDDWPLIFKIMERRPRKKRTRINVSYHMRLTGMV